MNKLTTSLTLISALFIAGTTQAAQVNFSGLVTSQTCQFDNLTDSGSLDVPLPPVSQGDLTTAGDVAGKKAFEIRLKGCTVNDNVYIKFGTTNADNVNAGTLKNVTGTAKNVNIQILKNVGGAESVTDLNNQTSIDMQKIVTKGNNYTFNYAAQYYATGASEAGTVASTAEIAITYQ